MLAIYSIWHSRESFYLALKNKNRAQSTLLQPLGIPIWIMAGFFDQALSDGIGYDVPGDLDQVFFSAYRMVVISRRPKAAGPADFTVQIDGAS